VEKCLRKALEEGTKSNRISNLMLDGGGCRSSPGNSNIVCSSRQSQQRAKPSQQNSNLGEPGALNIQASITTEVSSTHIPGAGAGYTLGFAWFQFAQAASAL